MFISGSVSFFREACPLQRKKKRVGLVAKVLIATFAVYAAQYPKLGFIPDFSMYTDSSYNWNVSPDSAVAKYYHFPMDTLADGTTKVKEWVLDSMNYYWEKVTFDQLVKNAEGKYDVTYKRNYSLDAELRVYDVVGTYSKTISKEIVIN